MTLSYADAMKKRNVSTSEGKTKVAPGGVSLKEEQNQTPPPGLASLQESPRNREQTRNVVQRKPSRNAWGRPAAWSSESNTKTLDKNASKFNQGRVQNNSSDWVKQPSESGNRGRSGIQILKDTSKNNSVPQMPVASNSIESLGAPEAWTTVTANSQKQANLQSANGFSKAHIQTQHSQKKQAQQKQQNASQKQPKQQQQSQKSPKRPRQQLKSMSIGDLIPTASPEKIAKQLKDKRGLSQRSKEKSRSLLVDSPEEFPSLGAPALITKSITAAKTSWGSEIRNLGNPVPGRGSKALPSEASTKKTPTVTQRKTKKEKPRNEGKAPSNDDKTSRSAAMFFMPSEDRRDEGGDEHQLLRLLQDRSVYQKKGRQRLNPRKKKFTALKKKILQERLKKWRDLHPEFENSNEDRSGDSRAGIVSNSDTSSQKLEMHESCTVCIHNFVLPEELGDEDEYNEIVENLNAMALRIGQVDRIFVPLAPIRPNRHPVFVRFQSKTDAAAARACWEGLTIGGENLHAFLVKEEQNNSQQAWQEKVLEAERSIAGGFSDEEHGPPPQKGITIVLKGFLNDEDFKDEDCRTESLLDLRNLASKYGDLIDIHPSDGADGSVQLTYDSSPAQALEIVASLNETKILGQALSANILNLSKPQDSTVVIVLENILTNDDLEDEDCMIETLNDIQELVGRHGVVSGVEVENRTVKISYDGPLSRAYVTASELNGLMLGGNEIIAHVETKEMHTSANDGILYLQNLLTKDDLEDEDCLEESLNDVRQLASKNGRPRHVEVVNHNGSNVVRISFGDGNRAAAAATAADFDGMIIGGSVVQASLELSCGSKVADTSSSEETLAKRKSMEHTTAISKKPRTSDTQPLYSGDKLIPERFAQAKRVPKIPNAPGPRPYAQQIKDDRVKPLLSEMLGELMRLQKRAAEEKNSKAKRRLVMGLREVARGIRSHKVKMVIMANNLDEFGAIDEKLLEIIDLAKKESVPIFFEFTKRSLGKAVGKSIKVAVVGVQNADGAHQPFKKLTSIMSRV